VHFTVNNPGSAVKPTPESRRAPAVATNGLSLDSWFLAMSYRTAAPSTRRCVVSDVIATWPFVSNSASPIRYVPLGAVKELRGLPNVVVNCARRR